jgi:cytochrome b involved in lipid metabolism
MFMIFEGRFLDLTKFKHPGGHRIIHTLGGSDATIDIK